MDGNKNPIIYGSFVGVFEHFAGIAPRTIIDFKQYFHSNNDYKDEIKKLNLKNNINRLYKGVNDNEILDFIEFVRNKPINIRFIEFFSIGNNGWNADKMISFNEMKEKIEQKYGRLIRKDEHFAETAKNYTLDGIMGNISFITSVSMPFCGTCNRIRLLSDGNFRRCLHDDNMLNLKDIIQKDKSDDLLLEAISQHLKNKKKAHAGMDVISQLQKNGLQMIKIGG